MPIQVKTQASDVDKHESDVTCLLYHKDKLYSAADDGKIKVWTDNLELLGLTEAHPCSVFSLTANEDTVYSCSNDGTIKAWSLDLKDKGLLHKGETEIWKILYINGILYAGDDQGDVMLFKNNKFFCGINILEPVKDMVIIDNFIYAIRDIYLTIVEIKIKEDGKGSYTIVKSIHGRGPISLEDGKLFFMDRLGKGIVVIESSRANKHEQVAILENAHELIINSIIATKKTGHLNIYTGGWDKLVKSWKLTAEKSLKEEDKCSVNFPVTVLTTNDDGKIIFAAGGDGHIVRIDAS